MIFGRLNIIWTLGFFVQFPVAALTLANASALTRALTSALTHAQTMREMCAVVAQSIRNLDVN